jgi:hypothetical protein
MAQKSLENIVNEKKKPINEDTLEIRDLNRWLQDKKVHQQIQSTFHIVFSSPKNYNFPGKKLEEQPVNFTNAVKDYGF